MGSNALRHSCHADTQSPQGRQGRDPPRASTFSLMVTWEGVSSGMSSMTVVSEIVALVMKLTTWAEGLEPSCVVCPECPCFWAKEYDEEDTGSKYLQLGCELQAFVSPDTISLAKGGWGKSKTSENVGGGWAWGMDVTIEIPELLCNLDRVTLNVDWSRCLAEVGTVLDLGFCPWCVHSHHLSFFLESLEWGTVQRRTGTLYHLILDLFFVPQNLNLIKTYLMPQVFN